MKKLLNTLYINTQQTYLKKEGETIVITLRKKKVFQIPMHNLEGIVTFGNISFSPFLIGACAKRNIAISMLTEWGKFLAAIRGPISGNVLLRRAQYRFADDGEKSRELAVNILTGKLANARTVLNRAIRDHSEKIDKVSIQESVQSIELMLKKLKNTENLNEARGLEGKAANTYFSVFDQLILDQKNIFNFQERNKRPPTDFVNSMLSFVYTLLTHDMRSAIETVGLDPMVGFLHRDRPGRPGLALDLIEEFRHSVGDRLVLSLINRRQVNANGFSKATSKEVRMTEETRKTIITEYQNRKKESIFHPFIEENIPIGLLFFVQANLLARYLRGDLNGYPPFFWR